MNLLYTLKDTIPPIPPLRKQIFADILERAKMEGNASGQYGYSPKVHVLSIYKKEVIPLSAKEKIDFARYCMDRIYEDMPDSGHYYNDPGGLYSIMFYSAFLHQLVKRVDQFDDADLTLLVLSMYTHDKWRRLPFKHLPAPLLVQKLAKQYQTTTLSDIGSTMLDVLRQHLAAYKTPDHSKEILKLTGLIDAILFRQQNAINVRPAYFLGQDELAEYANGIIKNKKGEEQHLWFQIIDMAQTATGSSPSKKYLDNSKKLIDQLGPETFKKTVFLWFTFVIEYKETINETRHEIYGRTFIDRQITFLHAVSLETLKGIVWMTASFNDQPVLFLLSKLAERCFRKIPGKGAPATSLGNACLFTLYESDGLGGIGQLSRLQTRIKQPSTQAIIKKYLDKAAQEMGVSRHEIEDLAASDFELQEGVREFVVGHFIARLEITGIGKSQLRWINTNGLVIKSVPIQVKEEHADMLKEIKSIQKQVDQATSAQRERIDRMLRIDRNMTLEYFISHYIEHGLLSFIIRKIIWNFNHQHGTKAGIYNQGHWVDADGILIDPQQFSHVSLWHPVHQTTSAIKRWRDYLVAQQIQQPIKQAFREIYLLTEAEITTGTYSNRMAAHILKQHQYVMLAKGRQWKAKLIGAWDSGDDSIAKLDLPEYDLTAQYWVNALDDQGETSDTGVWKYISTDQIRFVRSGTREIVSINEVPVVVFSEVMRDVDLFVGVASVGNDPAWRDNGGLPQYGTYWQSYAFGDLSEMAKTRKELLQVLLPKLKIKSVCEITDKFLVVRGKIRTYKIHLGSTNILMDPNDQYLCIVEDRNQRSSAEKIFLPFEGDSGFSLILSKAFLLAADDKITDGTILMQINRK